MAVVELIFDIKAPAWVVGNTQVLSANEFVMLSNGTYSFGDGVTQVQNLTWYGGSTASLSSVLSVGRTTGGNNLTLTTGDKIFIGSDETRHIEYDNAGIEIHNATSSAIVSVTDSGYLKVNAIQYMPLLTASRLLSLDANREVVVETGTGFLKLTSGVISYDNSNYLTTSSASSTYVPYTGATTNLNLGSNNLYFNTGQSIDVNISGGSDTLNIGTSNADVINIGYSGSIINIQGTLAYQNVTNLQVTDKLITLNKGGGVASGVSSGFEIEENAIITGWFATDATRTGWDFKAPASTYYATMLQSSLTANRTYTMPNQDGTFTVLGNTTTGSGSTLVLSTSPTITTPTFSGFTSFSSSGIPVTNEPNDFRWTVTGSTLLAGNNYGVRSSVDYDSNQNNSSWRLGAMLGTFQIKAADTGTLGWGVGVYGSYYNLGGGTVTRGIAGYFVAINNGSVATTNQFAVYAQTEQLQDSINNNYGVFVRTPIFTGGNLTNNYGLYIEDQQQGTNKWAIYSAGASDLSYFAGNLTVNGTLTGTTSIVGTTNVITPLIIGGSGAGSLITYKSSSGNATGTGTAHLFTGGNNGGTTILTMLNDGTIRIPNNRTIQGTDSAGTQRTLLNWSGGDNISILGRPGITDVTINPTNGGVGLYVKGSNGSTGIGVASPTSYCHLRAGTASANTSPLKFTTGTNLTTAEAGAMEYNNTFHLTNSDATRRHVVLAPNTTKVTAAAPYANDGYIIINIGGTDFKVMTTA